MSTQQNGRSLSNLVIQRILNFFKSVVDSGGIGIFLWVEHGRMPVGLLYLDVSTVGLKAVVHPPSTKSHPWAEGEWVQPQK